MSQTYDDFVAANAGYDDARIPEVPETIDEPGYRSDYPSILDHEAEVSEWERVNEELMPHIDEWDSVPAEVPTEVKED